MGSAASADLAELAWQAVQAEFEAVDAALSRFRGDSELTSLNRLAGSGGIARVSWRLRTMIAAVHRASRMTDGRFDASLVDVLEGLGERGADLTRQPMPIGDAPALQVDVDAGNQVLDLVPAGTPGASLVRIPERPLDSGGIGKGLALRWAAAAGIAVLPATAGLLLEAGGDITSAGEAPQGGWRIGVDDPLTPLGVQARPLAVYALVSGGVSTSSVAVRNWTTAGGEQVHHLLDPQTRAPARSGLISVSVAGPDAAWNEVWSKALFLGGRESIGEEARRRGLAAWWVDEEGRLGLTPEARVRSPWIAEERL